MRISLDWINDFIDISKIDPEEISRKVTMKSAEIEESYAIGKHFEKVKAAKITAIAPHPQADKLQLATVFDGETETTVVCGAPNIAIGQIVPFAPLGTVLPGNFEIKPIKIRGVESVGMLCAADELGLGDDHDGILLLKDEVTPGASLSDIFGAGDYILEVENKTINHRPDMWGHIGFAREIRAIFNLPWRDVPAFSGIKSDSNTESMKISIATDNALYYAGLRISNVAIAESPEWLKRRLRAVDLRPVNNIVDITNFVMMETGHPMHAFDRKNIDGDTIVIRNSVEGEHFISLDDKKHILQNGDIVIADADKILALGGVMGGANSQVTDETTELFVESALFRPAIVRQTAGRYDLRTDSSSRFEKALWVENARFAMQRFSELVKKIIPEAVISSSLLEVDNSKGYGFDGTISITPDYIRNLLGLPETQLSDATIQQMLELLDFQIEQKNGEWKITIPAHRRSKDVSIKQDIVEEVGRLFGFNNIAPVAPLFPNTPPAPNRFREKVVKITNTLALSFGGHHVINYLFVSKKDLDFAGNPPSGQPVRTVEEREQPWLRTSLVTGLLSNVQTNMKRYSDFTLFEMGRIFSTEREWKRLGVIHYTKSNPMGEMIKIATALMNTLQIPQFSFEPISTHDTMNAKELLHPGRGAIIVALGKKIGICGELHPQKVSQKGIKGKIGYIEFDEQLFEMPQKSGKFKHINKFPSTSFDVTVLLESGQYVKDVLSIVSKNVSRNIRESVNIADRFEGGDLAEGVAAVSIRVVLNGKDRTLRGEEMKEAQDSVREALKKKNYALRGE
ncbi:phenylalanine--tRNA ligase subunit beta [bacterium]|nr:phenylalanine--tRNA ligase subunit beta [bacterium]